MKGQIDKDCLIESVKTMSMWNENTKALCNDRHQLEQLERLRSEDTPHRLMITHTIESYWSQKKTKSNLQI